MPRLEAVLPSTGTFEPAELMALPSPETVEPALVTRLPAEFTVAPTALTDAWVDVPPLLDELPLPEPLLELLLAPEPPLLEVVVEPLLPEPELEPLPESKPELRVPEPPQAARERTAAVLEASRRRRKADALPTWVGMVRFLVREWRI